MHSTLRIVVLAQRSMFTGQAFVQRPQSVQVFASRLMPTKENELKMPLKAPRGQPYRQNGLGMKNDRSKVRPVTMYPVKAI